MSFKKPIFILIGFLLAIFLLGKYTAWQIEKWQRNLPTGFPKIKEEEIPKLPQIFSPQAFYFPTGTFPLPELTPPPQPTKMEKEEFLSPDGRLKIKYLGNWLKLEVESLQGTIPEKLAKDYQMRILFLAQKFEAERSGQLIVSQAIIDAQMEIEKLIEEIKKESEKQGWEIKILESKAKEREYIFEALYKKQNFPTLHSKEKMISLKPEGNQKKIFFIEAVTADVNWEYLEKEFEEILNSAQLIE